MLFSFAMSLQILQGQNGRQGLNWDFDDMTKRCSLIRTKNGYEMHLLRQMLPFEEWMHILRLSRTFYQRWFDVAFLCACVRWQLEVGRSVRNYMWSQAGGGGNEEFRYKWRRSTSSSESIHGEFLMVRYTCRVKGVRIIAMGTRESGVLKPKVKNVVY